MDIGERFNFNSKIMQFCLGQSQWTHKGDQDEALNRYSQCVAHSIVAEQLFRAELDRPKPGVYKIPLEDDE
jgi:hypothetical protein